MILFTFEDFGFHTKRGYVLGDKSVDKPDLLIIQIGWMRVIKLGNKDRLFEFLRMYINGDYSWHKNVRSARLKAISKARVAGRKEASRELEMWKTSHNELEERVTNLTKENQTLKSTITGLVIVKQEQDND